MEKIYLNEEDLEESEYKVNFEGKEYVAYQFTHEGHIYNSIVQQSSRKPTNIILPEEYEFVGYPQQKQTGYFSNYYYVKDYVWVIIKTTPLHILQYDENRKLDYCDHTIRRYFAEIGKYRGEDIRYAGGMKRSYIKSKYTIDVCGNKIGIYTMNFRTISSYFITTKEILNIPDISPSFKTLISPPYYRYEGQRVWFLVDNDDIAEYHLDKFSEVFIIRNNKISEYRPYGACTMELPYNFKVTDKEVSALKSELGVTTDEESSKLLDYTNQLCKGIDEFIIARAKRDDRSFITDSKMCINIVKDYYEKELSQKEIANKYGICSGGSLQDIVRYTVPQVNDIMKYIRLNRKRPLSMEDHMIINIYKDLQNGLTNEECCKKYLMSTNLVEYIGRGLYYNKNVLQYAYDNGLLGSVTTSITIEGDAEIESIISSVMYEELAKNIFGESTLRGKKIPYITIINIIKDYYEKELDIETIAAKRGVSVNLTKAFTKYKGKYTHKIMTHIHLDRKRPLEKTDMVIIKAYRYARKYGMKKAAEKFNTTVDTIYKIMNRIGYYRNIIDYAQEHNML